MQQEEIDYLPDVDAKKIEILLKEIDCHKEDNEQENVDQDE